MKSWSKLYSQYDSACLRSLGYADLSYILLKNHPAHSMPAEMQAPNRTHGSTCAKGGATTIDGTKSVF